MQLLKFKPCASKWAGEGETGFVPERCVIGCHGTSNCSRCACRACAHCNCASRAAVTIHKAICEIPQWQGYRVSLGLYNGSRSCREACDSYAGNSDTFGVSRGTLSCSSWWHHRISGECVGHLATDHFEKGWEPSNVEVGVALCAAPKPRVRTSRRFATLQAQRHNTTRPLGRLADADVDVQTELKEPGLPANAPSGFVVLHTATSFSMSPDVAERISRAYAESLSATSATGQPPLTHRVALGIMICTRGPGACNHTELRAVDDQAVGLLRAAYARVDMIHDRNAAQNNAGKADDRVARCPSTRLNAQSSSSAMKAAVDELQPRLPLVSFNRAVTLISPLGVERLFPNILSRSLKIHWSEQRQPQWLSNGCDLLALAWHAMNGAKTVNYSHLWVLQHDIGWTGSLSPLLAAAAPPTHDLVCLDVAQKDSKWQHSRGRSFSHHAKYMHNQSSCLLLATRYSGRLLAVLVKEVREGRLTYCEARAATACASRPDSCKIFDLRHSGFLLGPFSFFSKVNESLLKPAQLWHDTAESVPCDGSEPGQAVAHQQVEGVNCPARQDKIDGINGMLKKSRIGRLFHKIF